ncbi:MAG: YdcF family protein [Chitinophagales bacterium]
MKKYQKILLWLFIIIGLLFIFRNSILKAIGNFLIKEDAVEYVEYAFVLSGGAYDRGNKAIELLKENKIEKIICVGGNLTPNFKALGIELLESELTRNHILKYVSDSSKIDLIPAGTSTLEESINILLYCRIYDIDEIVIVSSKFHTRRIANVFKSLFKENGIQVYISGAKSSSFNEEEWWKSENGLIALNNEYLKMFYYFFK